MTRKLRIYSDKSYVLENTPYIYMLYPFWGGYYPDESAFNNKAVFSRYESVGNQYFEMTSIDEADILVAPVAWQQYIENRELTRQLAQYATPQKPIVIFFWHSEAETADVPNSIVFRTSFHKSTKQPNEIAMPLWREDYIQTHYQGNIQLRQKSDIPVIGFCGQALLPNMKRLQMAKDILRYIRYGIKKTNQNRQKLYWHVFRGRVLTLLKKSNRVKRNFITRSQFFGEVKNKQKQDLYQQEFIDNMINSDYIISLRGTANTSFRLYETLSFGRIPVFINTDCELPYESHIDWKSICVWVEENEIDQIEQKVLEFHQKLSPEDFINLQKRCRDTWQEYLSPEGFFKHFHLHFEKTSL